MKKRDSRRSRHNQPNQPSCLNKGKFALPSQTDSLKQANPFNQIDPFKRVNTPGRFELSQTLAKKSDTISQPVQLPINLPEETGNLSNVSSPKAVNSQRNSADELVRTELASEVWGPDGNPIINLIKAAGTAVVSGVLWAAYNAGKLIYEGGQYILTGLANWSIERSGLIEALDGVIDLTTSEALQNFVQNLPTILQAVVDWAYDTGLLPNILTSESEGGSTREERLEELSNDQDRGRDATTEREARAGLGAEEAGLIPGPIRRPREGETGDFIDANGQSWDEKAFQSRERVLERRRIRDREAGRPEREVPDDEPVGGEYNTEAAMDKISNDIEDGENVIINTEDLNPTDLSTLRDAIQAAGWANRVIYYP